MAVSSIKVIHPGGSGGKASVSLAGAGESSQSPSIRVTMPSGGRSTLNLAGADSAPRTPSTKHRVAPGGPSSISFSAIDVEPSKHQRRGTREPPGGMSSLDLSGSGPHMSSQEPSCGRRRVQAPHSYSSVILSDSPIAGNSPETVPYGHEEDITERGRRACWKEPATDAAHERQALPGALALQSSLAPNQRSQIVIADDNPKQADFSPRAKGVSRTPMQVPGGASSITFG